MTKETFLEEIKNNYSFVKALSDKSDPLCLLEEHRETGRRVVIKILSERSLLYEYLSGIVFPHLPYSAEQKEQGHFELICGYWIFSKPDETDSAKK